METYQTNPDLFIERSNLLKALASPQRLCIVKMLCRSESITVTDMQVCLSEAQPTVSQHLARLKAAGIIRGRRKGTSIYYSLSDGRIRSILHDLLRDIFPEESG